MRILEITDELPFIKPIDGHQIDVFYAGSRKVNTTAPLFTPRRWLEIRNRIRSGYYDLVACSITPLPLWRKDRDLVRNILNVFKRVVGRSHNLGLYAMPWILGDSDVAALLYNRKDPPILPPQNFRLARRCRRVFIRELPQNNLNTFLFTSAKNEDVVNILRQPLVADITPKMRPMPLGFIPENPYGQPPAPEKKTDIFYAGKNHTTTVRARGLQQLEKLQQLGYRVDIPEKPIPHDEFLRRCAEAWIVWSPEGQGWDCHRHYEALSVGSVPLINYPTIERYQPLEDGTHCLFYAIEGDGLVNVVRRALESKDRMRQIATAGYHHIFRWHTHEALTRYLIDETMKG